MANLKKGTTSVRYIYGGIDSFEKIIFFSKNGAKSMARNGAFKVFFHQFVIFSNSRH
jgi:hypothetical protein